MNNNNYEKFLPIGSVVLLKGGTKKAMVTGFCSVASEEKTKIYDYTGCIYPEGYLDFDQVCLFDHDQREKFYHLGYIDEDETSFKEELKAVAEEYSNSDDLAALMDDSDDEEEEDDLESEDEEISNDNLVIPIIEDSDEEKKDEFEYL